MVGGTYSTKWNWHPTRSGSSRPETQPWPCHWLTKWPWAIHIPSLGVSFLIFQRRLLGKMVSELPPSSLILYLYQNFAFFSAGLGKCYWKFTSNYLEITPWTSTKKKKGNLFALRAGQKVSREVCGWPVTFAFHELEMTTCRIPSLQLLMVPLPKSIHLRTPGCLALRKGCRFCQINGGWEADHSVLLTMGRDRADFTAGGLDNPAFLQSEQWVSDERLLALESKRTGFVSASPPRASDVD